MDWTLVGLIIMGLCLVAFFYTEVQRRLLYGHYEMMFSHQDFEGCLRLIEKPTARLVFPQFNRLYMRLNAQTCMDNAPAAAATARELLAIKRLTKEQRRVLVFRAFGVLIEAEDFEAAGTLLPEISELGTPEQVAECEMTYAIHAQGSSAYIDQMERELAQAHGPERARLCYLLSVQYENCGKSDRARAYMEQAREAFEELAAAPLQGGSDA